MTSVRDARGTAFHNKALNKDAKQCGPGSQTPRTVLIPNSFQTRACNHRLPGQILPLLVLKLCCDKADQFLAYPLGTMKGARVFKMYRRANLKLFTVELSAQKHSLGKNGTELQCKK